MGENSTLFLLVYCFIVLSSAISIFFLISIMKIIQKSERQENFKYSLTLKYYFWVLLTMDILMLVHTSTVLIIWRDDLKLPFIPFFWTGTFDATFMTVIPFTTFALTLDKCLVILLKARYNYSCTVIMYSGSIILNIVIAGVNLIMNILFHEPELPEGCIAYGCVLGINTQLVYTYTRTIGIILSTLVGILFLIITAWLKKNHSQTTTRVKAIAEAVVFRAVIFGLLCDLFPHVFDAIITSITGDTPFRYIGPYSRVIMVSDLLLSSVTNWMVFKKIKKKSTVIQMNSSGIAKNQ